MFVSSVMKGFSPQRKAAQKAIESLRLTPVMAENFGAKPHSSQIACLEGVRASDIYVLVMGSRYGFVAQSGLSVTEEEFIEARSRGLPVLVFVQNVDREPKQQQFYERLGTYEAGYFIASFNEPNELQTKVTTALHDLIGQPGVALLAPAEAAAKVQTHLRTNRRGRQTLLTVIIIPARYGEEYVPLLRLGDESYQAEVAKLAMFGQSAIFQPQLGYRIADGPDYVEFTQENQRNDIAKGLQVHTDGVLILRSTVEAEGNDANFSLIKQYVINQNQVQRRLESFFSFADAHYATLQSSPLITSLYLSLTLNNINQKYFGHWPEHDPRGGMTLGMESIDDPLTVPTAPLKTSRVELAEGQKLAEKATAFLLREFKAKGREFKLNQINRW